MSGVPYCHGERLKYVPVEPNPSLSFAGSDEFASLETSPVTSVNSPPAAVAKLPVPDTKSQSAFGDALPVGALEASPPARNL